MESEVSAACAGRTTDRSNTRRALDNKSDRMRAFNGVLRLLLTATELAASLRTVRAEAKRKRLPQILSSCFGLIDRLLY
jgi:hypothetical protein